MRILCLLVTAFLFHPVQGQDYFYNDRYFDNDILLEAGLLAGGVNCLTDLGGRKGKGGPFLKDFNSGNTRPCGGLYFSLTYRYVLGLRIQYSHGFVFAGDSLVPNENSMPGARFHRNLHFRSPIRELALLLEIHPLFLISPNNNRSASINPYVLAGPGYFHFNPQAKLGDAWINLQPLHTEGQGFAEYRERQPYRLNQFNLQAGFGFLWELSAKMNLRFEILHRFLFTDYLDDVSTRYIDPQLFWKYLAPDKAALAQRLANRSQYTQAGDPFTPGQLRGNARKRDGYFSLHLCAGWNLNRKRRF